MGSEMKEHECLEWIADAKDLDDDEKIALSVLCLIDSQENITPDFINSLINLVYTVTQMVNLGDVMVDLSEYLGTMQEVVSLGKKDDIDWLPHFRKALEDYVPDKYRAYLKNRNNYGSEEGDHDNHRQCVQSSLCDNYGNEKGGHDNGTHRGKYTGPGSE